MSYHFPNNWSIKSLGEIGRCVRGLTYSPDNVVDNGLLVLRSSNIQDGRLSFNDNVYVDLEIDEEFLSKKGDIVICVRNGSKHLIGKSAIVKDDNLKSTHGAFMTVFRSDLNDYIQHLINSDKFYQFVSRDIGATINSINTSNLLRYKFPIPPLPEQKKIAAILTSVDTVIEKTQAQIDKLKDLKTGMMQELLTKGIGHTEFKDSPVGRIPVEWEVKIIGSLGSVITGSTPKTSNADNYNGSIPFISPADINQSMHIEVTKSTISEEGLTNTRELPANSICVVCIGSTIGKAAITISRCATNQQINSIVCKNSYPEYVYYLMMYYAKSIKSEASTQAVPIINKSAFSALLVQVPPLSEQIKIGKIIKTIDDSLMTKQDKLSSLRNIKKALMQDLLTGKVRVKV